MEFNFKEEYSAYSNLELLTIIRQPEDYQEAAVATAIALLEERNLSRSEMEELEETYVQHKSTRGLLAQNMNAFKTKTIDYIEPLIHPDKPVDRNKWMQLFMIGIFVRYLYSFYIVGAASVKFILLVSDCSKYGFVIGEKSASLSDCLRNYFNLPIFINVLTLAYIPLTCYLICKRRRWGWILLFSDNLFVLLSLISQSYIFFKYYDEHHGGSTSYFFTIVVRSLVTFFLWRSFTSDYFSIETSGKRNTVFVVIVLAIIMNVVIPILL